MAEGRKKMLVTGASGFLGNRIASFYRDRYEVCVPSHGEMDIADLESVKGDSEGRIGWKSRNREHREGSGMKIGEAQGIYREQVRAYQKEKASVSKQLQNLRRRMEAHPDEKEQYESEAATLELTLETLKEKQEEYQDYLSDLAEQYCAYWNATVGEQQADAAEEHAVDMAKIMEVARRIMRGAIVPASDERKLMEYSEEMYQTAKNIGAMVQRQKKEKYDSLWGDEEKKVYDDPREAAENGEVMGEGPRLTDPAAVTAAVSGE